MLRAVIELSKYILVVNIILYTLISYIMLLRDDRERRGFVFVLQYVMILVNHITGSLVLLHIFFCLFFKSLQCLPFWY